MPQRLTLDQMPRAVVSGAIQFFDADGQLDWPGLYLRRDDASAIALAIDAIEDDIKNTDGIDSVLYAVYFSRLVSLRDTIRRDVLNAP